MSGRKFKDGDRVRGKEDAPASFQERTGLVADYKGRRDYGVIFDDTSIKEYVDVSWIELAVSRPGSLEECCDGDIQRVRNF